MNISGKTKKKHMIHSATEVHTSPKRHVSFPGMAQLDCWKKPRTWDVLRLVSSYGI